MTDVPSPSQPPSHSDSQRSAGMDEFSLIRRYFHHRQGDTVALGPGDDAALVSPPPGQQLVMTQDTSLGGRHFPEDMAPADIGYRCLAVNLSDLAAMGARPLWFLLSVTLPQAEPEWLSSFAAGLFELADAAGISLVGGDVTRGPLSISIQATGAVAPGQALRRDGARPGDRIGIGGVPGEAGRGLQLWQQGHRQGPAVRRLCRPSPQLDLGLALVGEATAAIDVSDGVLADLGHLLDASGGLGARLEAAAFPDSDAFAGLSGAQRLPLQFHAGDDYLLLFTLPPDRPLPAGCYPLGVVEAERGVRLARADGQLEPLGIEGWRHF